MAEHSLTERLRGVSDRYEEVSTQLLDPEVVKDVKRYVRLQKEYKELGALMEVRGRYARMVGGMEEARGMLETEVDGELRALAREELDSLVVGIPKVEEEIRLLLLPSDPEDGRNAIVEIRGGTGGDEASLFAGDLYRMYIRYCESRGWKVELTHYTEGSSGGYKEVVFTVSGEGVYGVLKYESGVHRVQRVPRTETQGRVHTSAATVAVLPEADEFDVEVREGDIRTDIFCASGHGGQSVNTTYSAIRLVHIPTGITVQCQDEKSQQKNKAKALTELRSRIYNMEYAKHLEGIAERRKTMVSTGDRSAKIRTYNYPQGRVTDHRINYTEYNLGGFMDGEIQGCIDHLVVAENAERIQSESN
jgi:peptide chain release factor 1